MGTIEPGGAAGRNPPDLECWTCGTRFDAGPTEPWRCHCGGPLELVVSDADADADADTDPPPRPTPATLDRDRGMWAFESILPVDSRVSLGEGWTPLISADSWDVEFKLEHINPTGSFKDRGATAIVSRAIDLGVERLVDDSSGNAGAAIATYAARAGISASIYVPAAVKRSKLALIERVGATAVPIDGDRDAVTTACIDAVETGSDWYASHAWNPAFFTGTMTTAFEIAVQRDWKVPDVIVSPVGHGTLLLGLARGFERLVSVGWLDRVPRLVGVQAGGYAPLAAEFGHTAPENSIADGVQIRAPARDAQIVEAVRTSQGTIVALGEEPVVATLDRLHGGGLYVEPTSALAPAAIDDLRADGIIDPADDVVVPLTGSGLKMQWGELPGERHRRQ